MEFALLFTMNSFRGLLILSIALFFYSLATFAQAPSKSLVVPTSITGGFKPQVVRISSATGGPVKPWGKMAPNISYMSASQNPGLYQNILTNPASRPTASPQNSSAAGNNPLGNLMGGGKSTDKKTDDEVREPT